MSDKLIEIAKANGAYPFDKNGNFAPVDVLVITPDQLRATVEQVCADKDSEIARLQKELEEARTKSRNLVELVLVAREWHWVPCSQASDYVNNELFPRNQKFPGTNQNNNNKPMWNAIDAAIRQIGGGE